MALCLKRMLNYALDNADIVREAIYHHLKASVLHTGAEAVLGKIFRGSGFLARSGDHDDVRVWLPSSNEMGHIAAARW
jgi:hypothetical protein